MNRLLALIALLVISGPPRQLLAEPATGDPEPSAPAGSAVIAEESLDHRGQIGAAVRIGSGYRVIFPYGDDDCGELDDSGDPKSICRDRYPMWIEVSPSFGLTEALELLVDVRFFFEAPDFTDSTGVFIAPGFKYYTDAPDLLKFYLTGQVVFEIQDQRTGSDLSSFDFGVRSAMGMQVDLLRYVGLYLQAGLVLGFTRWFSFLVDASGGVQVRY